MSKIRTRIAEISQKIGETNHNRICHFCDRHRCKNAQREESYAKLCEQLREKGLHQQGLQWYLECFRYGMPPHGGWGMGGARFIKQLLGLPSLREATFLFRGPTRLMP